MRHLTKHDNNLCHRITVDMCSIATIPVAAVTMHNEDKILLELSDSYR